MMNLALAGCEADLLLLLNNDVEVYQRDWIEVARRARAATFGRRGRDPAVVPVRDAPAPGHLRWRRRRRGARRFRRLGVRRLRPTLHPDAGESGRELLRRHGCVPHGTAVGARRGRRLRRAAPRRVQRRGPVPQAACPRLRHRVHAVRVGGARGERDARRRHTRWRTTTGSARGGAPATTSRTHTPIPTTISISASRSIPPGSKSFRGSTRRGFIRRGTVRPAALRPRRRDRSAERAHVHARDGRRRPRRARARVRCRRHDAGDGRYRLQGRRRRAATRSRPSSPVRTPIRWWSAISSSLDLAAELGEGRFDVLVFGDVLEHLPDPLAALRSTRSLLRPGGHIVLSVPNVAHGDVRLALLVGRFPYADLGLLDSTHLRFFTWDTLRTMLRDAGFVAVEVRRARLPLFGTEIELDPAAYDPAVVEQVRNDDESTTYQFVVRAVPADEHEELRALVERAETAEAEARTLRAEQGADCPPARRGARRGRAAAGERGRRPPAHGHPHRPDPRSRECGRHRHDAAGQQDREVDGAAPPPGPTGPPQDQAAAPGPAHLSSEEFRRRRAPPIPA